MTRMSTKVKSFFNDTRSVYKGDMPATLDDALKLYNKVEKLARKHKVDPYDINNALKSSSIDSLVKKLRKLVTVRNLLILEKLYKSKKWDNFVKGLRKDLSKHFKSTISLADVENGMKYAMKPYVKNWLGFWSILTVDSKGSIRDIRLFDQNDYNRALIYIAKKNKSKVKDDVLRRSL